MEHPDTPPPCVLPPDLHRRAVAILRRTLPPPRDGDMAAQVADAIGTVTSLCPANPEETLLAIQFVVADARSMEVLEALNGDPQDERRLLAQSASMMRQSRGARSLLLRVQTARQRHARGSDAMARRGDARVRVQQGAARSVPVSATESRSTGNETAMRPADRIAAAQAAMDTLAKMLPVPPQERTSRKSGNETPMRRAGPAPHGTVTGQSPASPASDHEAKIRHLRPAPATTVLPDASVSVSEMIDRLSGNETPMRQQEERLFTPPLSLTSRLLAGAARVPETIVPRYRHPDANRLGRTAAR